MEPSATDMHKGFSIVEIVIAAAIFSMIGLAYSSAGIYAHVSAQFVQDRTAALALADEGLEAVRNIRTSLYANLSNGAYELSTSGNTWSLVGSPDTVGRFTRTITISSQTSNSKKVSSQVAWTRNSITRSVLLETVMTNLDVLQNQANKLTISVAGAVAGGSGNRTVSGITMSNASGSSIVIDKITPSWNKAGRTISNIRINGTTVWSTIGPGTPLGNQNSGTLIDIQDAAIASGASNLPMTMLFSGSMQASSLTLIFTMSDGSTKTVNVASL